MKKYLLLVQTLLLGQLLVSQTATLPQAQDYAIRAIPFTKVKITDQYWAPRLETVRTVTLPYTFQQLEETGRVKNFDIASGAVEGAFCGTYAFDDSDVYKIIEGAAYSLQVHPDPAMETYVDGLITKIAAAQEADGYLYTWSSIRNREAAKGAVKQPVTGDYYKGSDNRWVNEDQHSHELYNMGHLYEAAVAYYQATGKRSLLDVALKNADLVAKTFGWGKIQKATGHQEIEIGLVKLYQTTGEKRYLDLARFFLDVRGYGDAYMQNHQKVRDQREIAGHAVRACYMYAAMTDVLALSGSTEYAEAVNSIWNDVVGTKMYVTGGIGSTGSNEGFSQAFDLPNYSAYCETCSSIAFVLWNQRMFQLTGNSKYIDVLERTLYNALDAGLSQSGDRFFYPNPLESRKNVERSPWFTCACCPSNVARFFPSIPGYVYAQRGNEVYVNLFATSETTVQNINSKLEKVNVTIAQETNYPWDGKVTFRIKPEKPNTFTLKLRIPGWAQGDAVPYDLYSFRNHDDSQVFLKINDKVLLADIKYGYATIERKWKEGDVVELALPMPVRPIVANSKVDADAGRLALQRGPLIYCLEGKDQPDDHILNMMVPEDVAYTTQFEAGLLGGVQTISFEGALVKKKTAPDQAETDKIKLKAIPYPTWANRGKDNMLVWLPYRVESARALSQPTLASRSTASASEGLKGELSAISDQWTPKSSGDQENPFVHWWPHFGTTEWIQYDFGKPEQVGTARVYWFDDEASHGGCRVPKSWRVLYLDNGQWKPAYVPAGYAVAKDGWNEVQFEPVNTSAIRLEIIAQDGVSAGVHEWELR